MVRLVHLDRFRTMLIALASFWLLGPESAQGETQRYASAAEHGVPTIDGHGSPRAPRIPRTVAANAVEIEPCTIEGWSTGDHPNGLKVRQHPDAGAAVVGHLPAPVDVAGYAFNTQVSITGSTSGWFRIGRGYVVDYIGDAPTETVFDGEGWVPGRSLGLLVNHVNLYAKPSSEAQIVAKLEGTREGQAYGADSFQVERLLQCAEDWVEVEGSFMGSNRRGWATGTCANQVTTCP